MTASQGERSVACVVSTTNRSGLAANQDCVGIAENICIGIRAVLVADGLGSFEHAELAAQRAVMAAKSQLEGMASVAEIDIATLFLRSRQSVRELALQYCADNSLKLDTEHSFGTTMILGIDTPHELVLAYAGNGAIWHLRGNFNHFGSNRYVPWNAVNYLNPHTLENELGREALYRLISASDDVQESVPTFLRISKDTLYGDIVLVCTDGIASMDQSQVGKYRDGSVWVKTEVTMLRFYAALAEYFDESPDFTDASLREAMIGYLDGLRTDNLLDDDASLGLIVTPTVVAYQTSRREAANR